MGKKVKKAGAKLTTKSKKGKRMKKKTKKLKRKEGFKKKTMDKAKAAMLQFLPKTKTFVKSGGHKKITVKVRPGSSSFKKSSSKRVINKKLAKAKDIRKAAVKAMSSAKGGAAK